MSQNSHDGNGIETDELADWLDSVDDAVRRHGFESTRRLLAEVEEHAARRGAASPRAISTPYINSIPVSEQPRFPGDLKTERLLKSIIRWNALAMVVQANRQDSTIGGHISTYASAATLYEVGFNHFFKGRDHPSGGDYVYFQGHATPGIYARAFLEGRLTAEQLHDFRREIKPRKGVSSYPHPWLMPHFWEFPTVSMGLGPLLAIYQARFLHYLRDRGLKDTSNQKVWCFVGDGETDEPETLGSITLASREQLDNLIFVINCNLQRLDGPVRGNGKVIQELEGIFRGAGWNAIKVIWGSNWDPLLAADKDGLLVERMNEVVDGEFQKYIVEGGAFIRKHFFGKSPELRKMVEHLSDDELKKLTRGGHDPVKVHAAYHAAVSHKGQPTVILAHTVKGYGLGEAGEGRNITHSQKKLNDEELRAFRTRFDIPIPDTSIHEILSGDGNKPSPHIFYCPPADSAELQYLQKRRKELGGYLPVRAERAAPLPIPPLETFKEFLGGSGDREVATIMVFVRLLSYLLRDPKIGKYIVPIIPDEARTFGMDVLFRQCGIYSHVGQLYEPVDFNMLLYYREAQNGQLIEEGITEAGSLCSFLAAGTSGATHGLPMIPFFSFYSMFGFQRIGDLIWAAADSRARGFLLGGIAGRTSLAGEGLQHQDGHSHLMAATVPNLVAYDPAYAYEFAVIIQDGLRRMYQEREAIFYYITMYNEKYHQPPMPEGSQEGILKGMYRLRERPGEPEAPARAKHALAGASGSRADRRSDSERQQLQILGSGPLIREALRAQDMLADEFGIGSTVWSVTSYKELRRDALAAERWSLFHPDHKPRSYYVQDCLAKTDGPIVAVSDYMRLVPEQIAPWLPGRMVTLGTDGFGRSDSRTALRRFFEVDAEHIAFAALSALCRRGKVEGKVVQQAMKKWEIDAERTEGLEWLTPTGR